MNELLLIASLIILYGAVLLAYRYFGKAGLYSMTVFATIAANIEVLIVVDAFGVEQTLGNILFACTFLVTDILSECEGKKAASRAVYLGLATSILFLLVSQSWLLYTPSSADFASPAIHTIFSNTPRLIAVSLLVYLISQRFDVWLYHAWWNLTSKKSGSSRKFLWLRNNGSTMVSQFINSVLFNVGAFAGIYPTGTLIGIIFSTYLIYVIAALLDTPVIYLARYLKEKNAR